MFIFLAQDSDPWIADSFIGTELQSGSFLGFGVTQSVSFFRANTHISSSDPKDKSIIDPRFFSHPLDIEIMAHNLLDVERMHSVKPLSECIKPEGSSQPP